MKKAERLSPEDQVRFNAVRRKAEALSVLDVDFTWA